VKLAWNVNYLGQRGKSEGKDLLKRPRHRSIGITAELKEIR
jgi:hypothetical protein